jgi:hypothetical protein
MKAHTQKADTRTQARLAPLGKELDAIHFANTVYWKSKEHTREATAEHHRRQERLEEIRGEIAQLNR